MIAFGKVWECRAGDCNVSMRSTKTTPPCPRCGKPMTLINPRGLEQGRRRAAEVLRDEPGDPDRAWDERTR